MVDVAVPESEATERADKALATLLGVSRGVARTAIESGDALVDGVAIKASTKLAPGTVVSVTLPDAPGRMKGDPSVPFDVLYEDDEILVIDKPIGVVVHAGAGATGRNTCTRSALPISRHRRSRPTGPVGDRAPTRP